MLIKIKVVIYNNNNNNNSFVRKIFIINNPPHLLQEFKLRHWCGTSFRTAVGQSKPWE